MSISLRTCRKCETEKPISEYEPTTPGNWRWACRTCRNHQRNAGRIYKSVAKLTPEERREKSLANLAKIRRPPPLTPEEVEERRKERQRRNIERYHTDPEYRAGRLASIYRYQKSEHARPKRRKLKLESRHRRRAALRGSSGRYTEAEFAAKLKRWKYRCHWCGCRLTPEITQRDHLIALSAGGENHIGNIVPSCATCNARKGAKAPWEFMPGRLL